MKKASESFPGGKYENSEVSRRLYRGAVEAVRRLEDRMQQAASLQDLFNPEVTSLRTRLKDYCERLMFSDPVEYGRKAEELLWRKVYYDVIQNFKYNKKKLQSSIQAENGLKRHLLAGIGSYHHLLLRLQTEFYLDLQGKVEVPFTWQQRGIKKERWKKYQRSIEVDDGIHSWANQACHRILVYLGDLARYVSDFGYPESCNLAKRYYHQALSIDPSIGIPHNQLGSISNWGCEAAYHYMRCLLCLQKFDGSEGNLIRVFEKNSQMYTEMKNSQDLPNGRFRVTRFFLRFLKLCEQFFLSQDENLQILCQDTLQDFDKCLLMQSQQKEEESSISDFQPNFLNDELIFKLVVMAMMCMARLQQKGSPAISAATAFTLALFSHIVSHSVQRLISLIYSDLSSESSQINLQEFNDIENISVSLVPSPTLQPLTKNNSVVNRENKENHNRRTVIRKPRRKRRSISHLRMLRRRRKMSSTSQEDSELSEGDINQSDSDEDVGGLNSDISETGSLSSTGSFTEHEGDDDVGELTSTSFTSCSLATLDISQDTRNNSSGCLTSNTDLETNHKNASGDNIMNNISHIPNGSVSNDIMEKYKPKMPQKFMKNGEELLKVPNNEEILLSAPELLEVLNKVKLLCSVKVLSDWMKTHVEILSACAESSRFLWSRVVELLNILLKVETIVLKYNDSLFPILQPLKLSDDEWKQVYPLPEDIQLQHLVLLEKAHADLSFDTYEKRCLSPLEQNFLRVQCLLSFGASLASSSEILLTYDVENAEYTMPILKRVCTNGACSPEDQDTVGRDMESQRKQLMRNMAHLWLKAEVNDLEVLVEGRSNPQLSPYLVPDTDALCHHLPALKQLVLAKRFIVIVPSVVIASLDQLKKESLGAREAIRWLEAELRRGCRYIRAQRQQERLSLMPVKYPRKKDKESWDYFQILECCNYLNQHQPHQRPTGPLVTLVIGNNNLQPSNSTALAQSVGVNKENIEAFVSKWKTSCKNPG